MSESVSEQEGPDSSWILKAGGGRRVHYPNRGSGPLPKCLSARPQKAQRSVCHQLIVVNKVDLLFESCHHSCVVFDARPTGSEKIMVRSLKERRRPQKVASLAAGANPQDCGQRRLLPESCSLNVREGDSSRCLICKSCVQPRRRAGCLTWPPRISLLLGTQMQASLGHLAGRGHWVGGFSPAMYL